VHPSKHVYAKMALNLLEKIAPQNQIGSGSGHQNIPERKWSWSRGNQIDRSGGDEEANCGSSSNFAGGGGRQTQRNTKELAVEGRRKGRQLLVQCLRQSG
jgi:hypothetical protein